MDMMSSSQSNQSQETLFYKLLNDIYQLENENERTDENEDALFLEWCNKITKLNTDEFTEFDEQLCLYLLCDWANSSCFRGLIFLSDIISYICMIADIEILEEHLSWFSQSSMPPHILLVVYPALLTVANKRRSNEYLNESDDTFRSNFEHLMFKLSQENSTEDISKLAQAGEVLNFWKDNLNQFLTNDPEELDRKIFSAFLCYHSFFKITCKSHNPRLEIIQLLYKSLRKKHEKGLILCSLFIVFIKSIKIESEVQWKTIKAFLEAMSLASSNQSDENLKDLVSKSIQTFTQHVEIFNENLLDELSISTLKDNSISKDTHKEESQQDLNSDTKENVHSKSILKPTVDQNQLSDKFLDSLAKLIDKMQSSNFQLTTSAQRERLKHQITNLNNFL